MKPIFITLIAILSISLVIAGGIALSERVIEVTSIERNSLVAIGVSDFNTTELKCYDNYCTFWIIKKNISNSLRTIWKYKEVCTNSVERITEERCTQDSTYIDIEGKEIFTKGGCTTVQVDNPIRTCVQVLKTDAELQEARRLETDSFIKQIANSLSVSKNTTTKLNPEKVVIGVARVVEEPLGELG